MIYALDENNNLIEATETGQRAIDPYTKTEVISAVGEFNVPHWRLKSTVDYDSWSEPVGPWHIKWQKFFRDKYNAKLEVIMYDKETGEKHIADVVLPNGIIIEIQHSPIKVEEIEDRERFYGNNMIWFLDIDTMFNEIGIFGIHSERYLSVNNRRKFIEKITRPIFIEHKDMIYMNYNNINDYYPVFDIKDNSYLIFNSDDLKNRLTTKYYITENNNITRDDLYILEELKRFKNYFIEYKDKFISTSDKISKLEIEYNKLKYEDNLNRIIIEGLSNDVSKLRNYNERSIDERFLDEVLRYKHQIYTINSELTRNKNAINFYLDKNKNLERINKNLENEVLELKDKILKLEKEVKILKEF